MTLHSAQYHSNECDLDNPDLPPPRKMSTQERLNWQLESKDLLTLNSQFQAAKA